MRFGTLYVLDGANRTVPCEDVLVWARWAGGNRSRRLLAESRAGEAVVRTIFLGINCQVRDVGPPLTFNTEVFLAMDRGKHEHSLAYRLYATYDEAMRGHDELVNGFKNVAGIIMGVAS